MRRTFVAFGTAVATVAALLGIATPAAAEGEIVGAGGADAIKGSYIVVYSEAASARRGVDVLTDSLAAEYGATVEHTYRHALRGFSGTLGEQAARRLAADPAVDFVQQNATVRTAATQPNPPSWGLDRIDQRDLPLAGGYTYPNTAPNVTAYIVDTGIRTTHQDFGGRATWGANTIDDDDTDCDGHGTHVAGTVGGASHGVAKQVSLIAVKVLDCEGEGTSATVAAGVDWVTGHHTGGAAVANMSIGGGAPDPVGEIAVRASIADGVTYAVAAGNDGGDSCDSSPANVTEAITVSATDNEDYRALFSNYGTCTDVFAPGVDITSAYNGSDTDTEVIGGTSMASPHVAGAAALVLGAAPSLTPAQVADTLLTAATPDRVNDAGPGSPNRLLFVEGGGGTPGGPTVVNPGNRTNTSGASVSLQVSASGGAAPYSWSATGLPPGLSIGASSGLITGTVTTAGVYNVVVTATDADDRAGSTAFTWTVNPSNICTNPGQKLANPGFESGTSGWSGDTDTIGEWTGDNSPRTGVRSAWLGGYGSYGPRRTDTVRQTVTIPAGCVNSRLSLYLKVHTGEYPDAVYDTFTVRAGSTTLGTFSNLNAGGYIQRTFNVGSLAGQTVTFTFTSVEDSSIQTSFVIDDLALAAS